MARDKELMRLRDERIRELYVKLRAKHPGRRIDDIIREISQEHVFVSTHTIEQVLYMGGSGRYVSKKQQAKAAR